MTQNVFGIEYKVVEPPSLKDQDRNWLETKLRGEFDRRKEIWEIAMGFDEKLIAMAERFFARGEVSEEFVNELKRDL